MGNNEALIERERIKQIISNKIDDRVAWRKKHIHKRSTTSLFEKLKDDLLFLIDNPDHVRKT